MELISLDLANSFVKVSTSTKNDCYINRYRDVKNGGYSLLSVQRDDVYSFNGVKLSQCDNGTITSSSRSSDRYSTSQFLFETLIAITKVTNKDHVTLMVGLPCADMDSSDIKQSVVANLTGTHTIEVNGITRTITIHEVIPNHQPIGTIFDLLVDSNLTINEQLLNLNLLVIDLGYGTCDVVSTVGDRIQWSKGFTVGTMTLVNKYLELINNKAKTSQLEFTLEDIGVVPNGIINKYQNAYDFSHELNIARDYLVKEFNANRSSNDIKLSAYDCVIFTGGATTELLKDNYYTLPHNAMVVDNHQQANVNGLLKLLHYMKRGH